MAKMKPRARFIKKGASCPVDWTKKTIKVNGGERVLCLAPKDKKK